MAKERLTLKMSMMDAIVAVSDGNPGATRVCLESLKHGATIDPQNTLGGLGILMAFDTHTIYGPDIWRLYKDVCKQNLTNMIGVLRAVQLGHLTEGRLKDAIAGDMDAVDVEAALAQVRKELKDFQRPVEAH